MATGTDASVLIFARAPVAGNVKTRLIPLLGEDGAAALYRTLVERALSVARGSAVGPVELWCTPTTDDDFFLSCSDRFDVVLHPQGDGDLGARMLNAFEDALTRSRHVLLTGSDCPTLTPSDLRAAARALREGHDAAFGPAEDGGYVLVGLSQAMPALFDAIAWGTATVMEETRQRLRNLGWHWHELPKHWDVDRPQDYQRLVREGLLSVLDSGGGP
ncbi:MAG TPA: TIGR04282 family arsenosugar biosynthesis glycosyltransferase [Burkholderiales bacterium]|nr:TIGR04282 family arsenosugar biosynthesis glycosyltransferase [Burkholderiales bacterium]